MGAQPCPNYNSFVVRKYLGQANIANLGSGNSDISKDKQIAVSGAADKATNNRYQSMSL